MASSVVYQPDYGWFTPDDIRHLFEAIHKLPNWETVVLVGGQSLTTWVVYYGIQLPPLEGPYLTQDADFLGNKNDAQVIAKHLGGKAEAAHFDDNTVNTAVIEFTGQNGQRLQIDMLGMVLGLTNEETLKLAVPVQLYEDWEPIRVLHPLLVLESRCANLERLPGKRTGNGITQAKVAVEVAKAYVQDCLRSKERRREAFNAARRIAALATHRNGIYVWRKWGIDVLAVIDANAMPGLFLRSWKYAMSKIERKREIARRLPLRPRIAATPSPT